MSDVLGYRFFFLVEFFFFSVVPVFAKMPTSSLCAMTFFVCDDFHRQDVIHLSTDEERCGNELRARSCVGSFLVRLCAPSPWVEWSVDHLSHHFEPLFRIRSCSLSAVLRVRRARLGDIRSLLLHESFFWRIRLWRNREDN